MRFNRKMEKPKMVYVIIIMETSQNQKGEIQRTDSDFPTGTRLFKEPLVGGNEACSQE